MVSDQMRELAAHAVHAYLAVLVMEAATLAKFVLGGDVLLLLNLTDPMGEGTPVSEATHIVLPVFTYFCPLLDPEGRSIG